MATPNAGSVDALTFGVINDTVFNVVKSTESNFKSTISGLGENPTTTDLLMVQQGVQQWTLMVQIQSTVTKEIGDAMKGIIQKAS